MKIHRHLKTSFALAALAMASTSANAASILLINPSFETGSPSGNGSGVTPWTLGEGGGHEATTASAIGTTPSDGTYFAWVGRFGNASKNPAWMNDTGFTPVSGDLVTLTVDVGAMTAGAMTRIQLFDTINSTVYATSDYTPALEDTWYESSTSYTSNGSEAGPLGIRLMFASGAASERASFDDVRLDSATVPEPSATALLGLGGLALILRRRK